MTKRPLGSTAGFTYIAALVMVVIIGIMLSQAAQVWSTKMKREREVELLFRGCQVRDALRRWYKIPLPVSGYVSQQGATGTAAAATTATVPLKGPPPTDLKALVSGTGSAAKTHYLRPSMLIDPMTGKEWGLVKNAAQWIVGVASTSDAEPLKQANFPFDLDLDPADFEGKKKYSEWQFIVDHHYKAPTTGVQKGLDTTNSPVKAPAGTTGAGNGGTPGSGNTPQ